MVKLSLPKTLFASECAVIGCNATDLEIHHVRALIRKRKGFTVESILSTGKTTKGLPMIESALARKQIPLCTKHHTEWHKISRSQVNSKYLKKDTGIKPVN
jgi:hypothetical protein